MPAFRPSSVRIHPDLEGAYAQVERKARGGSKSDATLWRAFLRCVESVRRDGQWGEVIPRIPSFALSMVGLIMVLASPLAGDDGTLKLVVDIIGLSATFLGLGFMLLHSKAEPENTLSKVAKITRTVEWVAAIIALTLDTLTIGSRAIRGEYYKC